MRSRNDLSGLSAFFPSDSHRRSSGLLNDQMPAMSDHFVPQAVGCSLPAKTPG
jgi:hypothetical protein